MTRGNRGSQPDPSTVSGKPETGLGGGGAAAQVFDRPLKNIYPGGFRVPSTAQELGGLINPVPTPPDLVDVQFRHSVVVDPQDGDLIFIGLEIDNSSGAMEIYSFDTVLNEWSVGKYPSLDTVTGYSDKLNQSGCTTVGNYIVSAGGITQSTDDPIDDIVYIDTSASNPTWQKSSGALPAARIDFPHAAGYNGSAYIIGGANSSDDTVNTVTEFEPSTGNVFQLNRLPITQSGGGNTDVGLEDGTGCPAPIVDGEAYLTGLSKGYFDGEELSTTGLEFFKYDLETEDLTRLADIDVLNYAGSPSGNYGFGNGTFQQVTDDLMYYMDGYYYLGGIETGVYSISEDAWAPVERVPDLPIGDPPLDVTQGTKAGVIKDGVIYYGPTGSTSTNVLTKHYPPTDFADHT